MNELFEQMEGEKSDIDQSLKVIINQLRKNEKDQSQYIRDKLNTVFSIQDLSDITCDPNASNEEKLQSWKELSHSILKEIFSHSYLRQIFLSIALIAFSLTGKQIFDTTSESMTDGLEKMFESLDPSNQLSEEEQKQKEEADKKLNDEIQQKKERLGIIHAEFLQLLFEILKKVQDWVITEIDESVSDVMSSVSLRSKFTDEEFIKSVMDEIQENINEKLFGEIELKNNREIESDDEFDTVESDTSQISYENDEKLAHNCVPKIVKFIIAEGEKIELDSYEERIESQLSSSGLLTIQSENLQENQSNSPQYSEQLETLVRALLDHIETPYYASTLIDMIEHTHLDNAEVIGEEFKANYPEGIHYAKVITLLVKLRGKMYSRHPILDKIEVSKTEENKEEQEENKEEDSKVEEVSEDQAKQFEIKEKEKDLSEINEENSNTSQHENEEEEKEIPEIEKVYERVRNQIRAFSKFIFYEGNDTEEEDVLGDLLGGENSSILSMLTNIS